MWISTERYAMDQIKDKLSLFSFVKAVGKDKEAAFKKQSSAIRILMYRRHYSKDSIDCLTFRCYYALLQAVHQLTYDHGACEGGPGKAMLDYHSIQLLQVRQHALSRKMLILETYVYLQDVAAKSFYHESMTEHLWELMAELTTQQASMMDSYPGVNSEIAPGVPGKEGPAPRCSHCRNAFLHKLLDIQPTKKVCFFIDLSQAKA
jgi:hypothetical protein